MRRRRTSILGSTLAGLLALGIGVGTALPAEAAVNKVAKRFTTQTQCAIAYASAAAPLAAQGYTLRVYHSCQYKVDSSVRPWLYEFHYWK
ncbi:hypothetical protein ACFQ80_02110 [Isoptericola sp. NPDC056578]|uniref:hypothetical protein n=1 Tax=Isoptericola sp. NPDC056578 TaxID=3345870 RepID=UPI0036B46235